MILNKKKLIDAIKVLDLIPSQPGVPSSEFIKVHAEDDDEGVQFLLTSSAAGEVAVGPNDGSFKKSFYIDRRVLVPFLSQCASLKTDSVSFERSKDSLEIKIGRRKLLLTAVPKVAGYSEVLGSGSAVKGIEFDDEQKAIMTCALKYAPVDESLQQLQCVCLYENLIMTSNDVSIFCGETKHKNSVPGKTMIPLFAASLISTTGVKKIEIKDGVTSILFDTGKIVQSLPSQATKSFPIKRIVNMSRHLPGDIAFIAEPRKLLKTLERFSAMLQSTKDKLIVVSGKRGDTKVQMSSVASHAKFTDYFNVKAVQSTFKCEWLLDTVLPFATFISERQSKLAVRFDDKSPYFLDTEIATLVMSRKSN